MKLAHELVGAGYPLVLIPGTFSSRRVWLRQLPAFAPNRRCLLLDQPGTGESPPAGSAFSPDDLADAVLGLMDSHGVERADLVGHSLGASVALIMAARYPGRVRAVAAAAPVIAPDPYLAATFELWEALAGAGLDGHAVNLAIVLGAFGREAFGKLVPRVLAEMDERPLSSETVAAFVACNRGLDLRGVLARVDARVLVVVGAEDALSGVGQARQVAAATPGARLEVVPGAGHSVQVEAAPTFNRLVAEFLTR